MKATSLIVGLTLLAVSPLASQTAVPVADGVVVLQTADSTDRAPLNAGWVESADYLLLVDGAEPSNAVAAKPGRFLVDTYGSHRVKTVTSWSGTTRLGVSNRPTAYVGTGLIDFATNAVLGDGERLVQLIRVVDDSARAVALFVADASVLFAGDLVGRGRGVAALPTDEWIQALERLERLKPRIVVPGRGPLGDSTTLRDARLALIEVRNQIVEAVEEGKTRDDAIDAAGSVRRASLPEGTAESVYDEYVGVRPATRFVRQLGLREGPTPTADTPGWTRPTRVVVADLWPGRTEQIRRVAPGVEVVVARDPREAADLVEDADAILGWLTPEILNRAKRLRWAALYSAGVERYVAMPGFAESDVVLTNGQRIFAPGGAEHVLGMVLTLSRRLHIAHALQRESRWDNAPLTGTSPNSGQGSELVELRGRTLLVVGLGGIGTEVARLAHGIGMRVIATRASRREGPPFVNYVGLSSELLTLAAEADVIVNCVPLTPSTENMFDEEFFQATKQTAYFVNIGRGKTVDTAALTRALRDRRLAGAGLDVTEPEPLPPDHELWGLPNVIITPHVGGDSDAHMERIWLLFRENLRRFVAGEPLLSVVNKRRGY
jgi:phosphoglycerate dehydrogenase-like enzyme